jgi:hypothetical protein
VDGKSGFLIHKASAMWEGLVSDDIPVNTDEIERLNYILKLYEKENYRLVRENESKQNIIDAHERKKGEMETGKQTLNKKIKSLESNLKFVKMAGDGLTKKVGLMEIEINQLKEEKISSEQKHEREHFHFVQMESTFNKDRARLLQYVHDIELLSGKNEDLERRVKVAEEELRYAQTSLLQKIQMAESMISKTGQQRRTVQEQAEEMLALTREVYELRTRKNELVEMTTAQEKKIERQEQIIDKLTAEVQRLRREVLEIAVTQSQKSMAFSTGLCAGRVAQREESASHGDHRVTNGYSYSSPLRSGSLSSIGFNTLPALEDLKTSRPYHQMAAPSTVISSAATAYRPQKELFGGTGQSTSTVLTKASTWGPSSLAESVSVQDRPVHEVSREHSTTADGDRKRLKERVKPAALHNTLSGMGNRSLFLGQGLGIKQDREPAYSATGGTAKQVLKKILEDFEKG